MQEAPLEQRSRWTTATGDKSARDDELESDSKFIIFFLGLAPGRSAVATVAGLGVEAGTTGGVWTGAAEAGLGAETIGWVSPCAGHEDCVAGVGSAAWGGEGV